MSKRKIQLQTISTLLNNNTFIKINKKIKLNGSFNTETVGMTCEYAICDIFFLQTPPNLRSRINIDLKEKITPILDETISKYFNITEYIGYKNGVVDFVTDNNKNISIKTNTSGNKVAPQAIGQASKKKFCEYFNLSKKYNEQDIKEYIINNTNTVLSNYIKHLFCCDYIIYLSTTLNKTKTELTIYSINIIDCKIYKSLIKYIN